MDDDTFLAAFENATLPRPLWTHAAHVRMAFLTLRTRSLDEAIPWVREKIKAYNASVGNYTGYHETITVAFLTVVAHRERGGDWESFAQANPALLERDALLVHYTPETLKSLEARQRFVPPDRTPLPC